MLKRKIEEKLLEWKNTEGHKPLIIKGCRQLLEGILEFTVGSVMYVDTQSDEGLFRKRQCIGHDESMT